ncbi:MAG: UvrB/UvrC motif-containing protein, partial [Streptococcaceae bacterium]|nr:UvrB/UvrC motif-containing protein [Streptococcaceae bacterium]
LVQTIGRAARNANGKVIMYADKITESMRYAIDETERRRTLQIAYNEAHHMTPKTIIKDIRDSIAITKTVEEEIQSTDYTKLTAKEKRNLIKKLEKEMHKAAEILDFELAASIRDTIMTINN